MATELSGTVGAALMLMTADAPRGLLCASDEVSARIEVLQFTLGEGPGLDAHHQHVPVVEPDLLAPARPRWIAFTPAAVGLGVQAIFAFPLVVGGVHLGALNLYRRLPGSLTDEQHADSLVVSGVAARTLLTMQADAPVGVLSPHIGAGSNLRLIVHQPSGMTSVQLGICVADALVRLCYAASRDLPIDEVAAQVVDRQLRFDEDPLGSSFPRRPAWPGR